MVDGTRVDYLSRFERFVSAGEGGLNGLGCRVNLTNSLI